MFQKKTRVHEREAIRDVKKDKCLVCKQTPVDPDHITTRGAGGDNSPSNLWPLCRRHHAERHQIGICTFIERYESAYEWLIFNCRIDVVEKCERKK